MSGGGVSYFVVNNRTQNPTEKNFQRELFLSECHIEYYPSVAGETETETIKELCIRVE